MRTTRFCIQEISITDKDTVGYLRQTINVGWLVGWGGWVGVLESHHGQLAFLAN